MDITLIIPAYNEEAEIGPCITSVLRNASGAFKEIIVVDNASTDKTADVAGSFPGVRVVRESTKGLMHARQAGFQASTSEVLAYIDADTRMPAGWVRNAVALLESRPDAVSASGPGYYYDATQTEAFLLTLGWWISAPLGYRLAGYMLFGAHFAVKRSALLAIGGFNTSVEFYGEDTDLARRLSRVGKTVFNMDFYILTSARRFHDEGMLKIMGRYVLNFLWQAAFGKPYTMGHTDIRTPRV